MSEKKSRTTTNSEVETRQFHERYLRAMNSPLRRKILGVLNKGNATIEELEAKTGLNETELKWHLDMLEHGFCIEKEEKRGILIYKLTQEGKVVNHIE
ncbi:MAG: winged helix-turn-helix domain-containing protein [Candidatus Bathyarchaeota archaeon]|nr:winged helix-turn-helix domain-containing protein [Candidatus Bathyarchaeota archaeon]